MERVKKKIQDGLHPEYFELIDESHQHSRSARTGELITHLLAIVVSKKFEGLSRVHRQKLIYQLVDDEMKSGLHALALRAWTPAEWENKTAETQFSSPVCSSKSKKT